jgi:hypothetical protein
MSELDSQERVHLEWMFENQPELVRSLRQQGKLRPYLDEVNQNVLRLVEQLVAGGRNEQEAREVANQSMAAPANGPAMSDNPPEPVGWKEQREILESL